MDEHHQSISVLPLEVTCDICMEEVPRDEATKMDRGYEVTSYMILSFDDPDEPKDFQKTIQRILSVSIPDCVQISPECRHLISRILVFDPPERINFPEIYHHEWFVKNLPTDLMDEKIMGNQLKESDQPM